MRSRFDFPDHDPDQPGDDDGDGERLSKSERKRQMHEVQALGEALTTLPTPRLEALALPESLMDALAEYHRTRSFEGKRRQLQYIGKLMRQVDPDPIREAIAAAKLGSAKETLALHRAERWREELMASDEALTRWTNAHPGGDLQQLRSLVRAARKDAKAEQPDQRHGRAYRELFQLIKAGLAQAEGPASDQSPADDEAAHDD